MGIEYNEKTNQTYVGRVDYKRKNIRAQNRQLNFRNEPPKQFRKPKHIHFDDDGNVIEEEAATDTVSEDYIESNNNLKI